MKKMKLFARITALMLVILMAFSAVSCSKDEAVETDTDTDTDTVSTEAGETGYVDTFNVPDVDYGGKDFNILVRSGTEHSLDLGANLKTDEDCKNMIDRAVYNKNKKIEEQFNVKFNFHTEENEAAVYNTLINSMVMPDAYDLVANHGLKTFDAIIAGCAVDWNTLEWVNLNNSWWNQSARTNWATPAGAVYAMNGDLSYMSIGNNSGIFWNKTIFNDVTGLTTPLEHVKAGTWTYANFKQTIISIDAAMDGDGTGNPATDSFAYATQRYRGPGVIVPSTGAQWLVVNNTTGMYELDIDNSRVIDAIQDYIGLAKSAYTYYSAQGIGTSGTGTRAIFAAGRAAMTEDNVKNASEFNGKVNFGLVPNYKYDDLGTVPSVIGSGTNTFMVPNSTTAENRTRISVILEAMAYYGQLDVIKAYYSKVLQYQSSPTEDDRQMLVEIHDSAIVSFAEYLNPGDVTFMVYKIIEGDYSDVSSALPTVKGLALADLDGWMQVDFKIKN